MDVVADAEGIAVVAALGRRPQQLIRHGPFAAPIAAWRRRCACL